MILGQLVIRFKVEPKDIWVGAYYYGTYYDGGQRRRRLYVCLLPCLPVMLDWKAQR